MEDLGGLLLWYVLFVLMHRNTGVGGGTLTGGPYGGSSSTRHRPSSRWKDGGAGGGAGGGGRSGRSGARTERASGHRRHRGFGGGAGAGPMGSSSSSVRRARWEEAYGPTAKVDWNDTSWEKEMYDDRQLEDLEKAMEARERSSPSNGPVKNAPRIPRYDLDLMKLTGIVMCVGRPGSGKSFLIAEIMWYMRDKLDIVIGFNPSESSSQTLKPFTAETCKYKDFDVKKMEQILEFQRECLLEAALYRDQLGLKDVEDLPAKYKNFFRLGVVADDCMKESKKINSPLMVDIAYQHRHLKLLFLIAVQYIMGIHPKIRDCIWYVALFFDPSVKSQAKMMENVCNLWGSGADALWQFRRYFLTCTHGGDDPVTGEPRNKHCCMFIDHQRPGKAKDRIFVYKATPRPPRFRVGRRDLLLALKFFEKAPPTIAEIKKRQHARLQAIREEAIVRKALENGEMPATALEAAKGKKPKRPKLPGEDDEDENMFTPLTCENPVAAPPPPSSSSTKKRSAEEEMIRRAAEAYRGRRYRHSDRLDPYSAAKLEERAYEEEEARREYERRREREQEEYERERRHREREARRPKWDMNDPLQAAAYFAPGAGPPGLQKRQQDLARIPVLSSMFPQTKFIFAAIMMFSASRKQELSFVDLWSFSW